MRPEFFKKDIDTPRYVASVAKTAAENQQLHCQTIPGDHFSFTKM